MPDRWCNSSYILSVKEMSQLLRKHLSPLKFFKQLNGNLLVPVQFIIPQSPAWPTQFHHAKLGQTVQMIRKDIKMNKLSVCDLTELASIGFIPDARKYQSERALLGFQEYKRIKGDLQQNYIVPESNEWSKVLHGLKLGNVLNHMRQDINTHKIIREAVTELGFNLIPTENNGADFPRTYIALESYKAIHGDVNIVYDFVVPHDDARYPENTWGMKLGQKLNNIRCNGAWSEHRAQLVALGVNYELINKHHGFEVIYSALESYKAIHGDVNIVQGFVVPHGDARYPENTWEMKLGQNLYNIRYQGTLSEHRAQLEALGVNFEVKPVRREPFEVIYSALESYKAIHGDVNIVYGFVVPHDDSRFPENTWGMKLGQNLYSIRCNGAWSEHITQLKALGVNYEQINKHHGFEVIYSALESYKTIHGDVNIVSNFVVPHDDARYPENTWGMKLGKTLGSIRCRGTWSKHRAQLEALGVNYEVKVRK